MKNTEQWLDKCPLPVVGRIVDSVDDVRILALSAAIYDEKTLVVMPIKTLEQLINSIRKA